MSNIKAHSNTWFYFISQYLCVVVLLNIEIQFNNDRYQQRTVLYILQGRILLDIIARGLRRNLVAQEGLLYQYV